MCQSTAGVGGNFTFSFLKSSRENTARVRAGSCSGWGCISLSWEFSPHSLFHTGRRCGFKDCAAHQRVTAPQAYCTFDVYKLMEVEAKVCEEAGGPPGKRSPWQGTGWNRVGLLGTREGPGRPWLSVQHLILWRLQTGPLARANPGI